MRCLIFLLLFSMKVVAQRNEPVVLFVCEHGSAKSVVAAMYFEKLAQKEGLNARVISRGVNPDAQIPDKVNEFLTNDGFQKRTDKPKQLSENDLRKARYVVMFSTLPEKFERPAQMENWNIPSFEAGYPTARDSIVNNVERLIQKIKADRQK